MVHLRDKWHNHYVRMCASRAFPTRVFCGGRTLWVLLSAPAAQNRVHWGTLVRVLNDVFVMLATALPHRHAGGIASELCKHPKHGIKC